MKFDEQAAVQKVLQQIKFFVEVQRKDVTMIKGPVTAMVRSSSEFSAIKENKSEIERIIQKGFEIYKAAIANAKQAQADLPKEVIARREKQREISTAAGSKPRENAGPLRLSAPYRFIKLTDSIVRPESNVALHRPMKGGLSATITIDWVAETPILAGVKDETNNTIVPLQLPGSGTPILPSPTLRGLIRSNLEVIAGARLAYLNANKRFGIRDFEHAAYKNPTRVGEVKAGWLRREVKDGVIRYIVESIGDYWAHVTITDIISNLGISDNPSSWCKKSVEEKHHALGISNKDSINLQKPFRFSDVTNYVVPNKDYRLIANFNGKHKGYIVVSGPMPSGNTKKLEYVFYDVSPVDTRYLKESVWEQFDELHSKMVDERKTPEGTWAYLKPLLEQGHRIPVFFTGSLEKQDASFALGLTRLFKIPHRRSIGQVLRESHQAHLPQIARNAEQPAQGTYSCDFVEHLFGHVIKKEDVAGKNEYERLIGLERQGRVAFSHAELTPESRYRIEQPVDVVQMAPRPSFAPFYLRSGAEKDYSATQSPELAGRKVYPPRNSASSSQARLKKISELGQAQINAIAAVGKGSGGGNVISHLRFLCPEPGSELRFRSRIKLHNVTPAELGAILFVLTHGGDPDKPCRFMIGRGKPFGAGQTRVDKLNVSVTPNDSVAATFLAAPSNEEVISGSKGYCAPVASSQLEDIRRNASIQPFIEAFCSEMRKTPGFEAFPHMEIVEEWLGAADPLLGAKEEGSRPGAENDRLSYLPVDQFRKIQKQTKPLPGYLEPQPLAAKGERDGRYLAAPRKRFWR